MDSPPLPTSASPPAHPSPTETSTRPPLTIDSIFSHFADSALGTSEIRTPSPKKIISSKAKPSTTLISPSKTRNSISDRLEQFAALAWEAEEDDRLDEHTRAAVQSHLHAIEAQLEGRTRGNEQTSSDVDLSNSATPNASSASSILEPSISQETFAQEPQPPPARPVPDLDPVLKHLNATVASMRARLTESKHLHHLSISRLSSIAQSNINLSTQLSAARQTATSLSHANAALRMQISDLEETTTHQSVTVSAMTGAVAGLESYVRSSSPLPATPRYTYAQPNGTSQFMHIHTPNSGARRQTIIRGTGRFRGKYPITSPPSLSRHVSPDQNMNLDGAAASPTPQNDLQEGILGWIRGFRDVEAGWREMDVHRSPTRFGNIAETGLRRGMETPTPTRRVEMNGNHSDGVNGNGVVSKSETEEESVLMQGDKVAGSEIFGREEDEFGDFQTVTSGADPLP